MTFWTLLDGNENNCKFARYRIHQLQGQKLLSPGIRLSLHRFKKVREDLFCPYNFMELKKN